VLGLADHIFRVGDDMPKPRLSLSATPFVPIDRHMSGYPTYQDLGPLELPRTGLLGSQRDFHLSGRRVNRVCDLLPLRRGEAMDRGRAEMIRGIRRLHVCGVSLAVLFLRHAGLDPSAIFENGGPSD